MLSICLGNICLGGVMVNPTAEWTKVVFHPLGLVGYVLFLIFGLIARVKRKDEKRWLLPSVLIAAAVALLGGLGLAYRDVERQTEATVPTPISTPVPALVPSPIPIKQEIGSVKQKSSAPCSPNVVTVGKVSVNCSENPDSIQSKRIKKTH